MPAETCFVIMPIGDQEYGGVKISASDLKRSYDDLIKVALLAARPSKTLWPTRFSTCPFFQIDFFASFQPPPKPHRRPQRKKCNTPTHKELVGLASYNGPLPPYHAGFFG
jgi:hypothetical protein